MERSTVRFRVQGNTTGLAVNGILELPLANGTRTIDVWLEETHQFEAVPLQINSREQSPNTSPVSTLSRSCYSLCGLSNL